MKVIYGRPESPDALRRPKVAIGTFDGVHVGHQALLRDLLTWARASDTDAVVLTFDRKPRNVLSGRPPEQITSLQHRLLLFERMGVDAAVVLRFDRSFASMEPEDFVREVLVRTLGASGVLLGHDTRFGRGARGDLALLERLGAELGFEVCSVPVVKVDGEPVSSTRVREAIRSGDLRKAEKLLGRRVSVLGTVVEGTGRGRSLGYPTANLDLHHEIHPPEGVYATRTRLGDAWTDSVTNIGRPPTLSREGPPWRSDEVGVETHILDFDGTLYGRDLEVAFYERIRPEHIFRSADSLAERIAADVETARSILARERQEAVTGTAEGTMSHG